MKWTHVNRSVRLRAAQGGAKLRCEHESISGLPWADWLSKQHLRLHGIFLLELYIMQVPLLMMNLGGGFRVMLVSHSATPFHLHSVSEDIYH